MQISTRKFGKVEIDDHKILDMPGGLSGFDEFEKFILLSDSKTDPFCWFQSTEEANLSIIVMNPYLFKPDYNLNLVDFIEQQGWEGTNPEDLLVYVVVNISGEETKKTVTTNLMGPLIINSKKKEVVQAVISNVDYSYQHNILAAA